MEKRIKNSVKQTVSDKNNTKNKLAAKLFICRFIGQLVLLQTFVLKVLLIFLCGSESQSTGGHMATDDSSKKLHRIDRS